MTNYTENSLHFLSTVSSPNPSNGNEISNFGFSNSTTTINNYSVDPLGSIVAVDANSFTVSDQTIAKAITDFQAISSSNPALSYTSASSTAFAGDGIYHVLASADATILASFEIEANQAFTFDFSSTVELLSQVNEPNDESAEVAGQSSFLLLNANNGGIVDYFTISGGVVTPGQNDFFLADSTQYVDLDGESYDYDFVGNQESVDAVYQGSYERIFSQETDLVLVELSSSYVELTTDYFLNRLGDDVIYGTIGNDTISGNHPYIFKIYAGHGDDIVNGGSLNNIIEGGLGDDTLYGDDGDDKIGGGAGNDVLEGGNGNDNLEGGEGNDHLKGQNGDDRLEGGNGNDNLDGGNNNDHLYGEEGNDYLYGHDGDDKLYGGQDDDYLDGGKNNDRLYGEAGNDNLYSGDGDDKLYGGQKDDNLEAGKGHDNLYGEAGRDILNGTDSQAAGYGEYDKLSGGAGEDRFILGDSDRGYYNSLTWGDYATIKDFSLSEDVVQLHGDRANYSLSSNGSTSYLYENTSQGEDVVAAFEGVTLGDNNLNSNAFEFV